MAVSIAVVRPLDYSSQARATYYAMRQIAAVVAQSKLAAADDFLKAAGDADKIDEVVLSGGGAHIPFLREILSEKHGMDFTVHNPLDGIDFEEGVFGEYESDLDRIAPLLTVGIGLALRKAGK